MFLPSGRGVEHMSGVYQSDGRSILARYTNVTAGAIASLAIEEPSERASSTRAGWSPIFISNGFGREARSGFGQRLRQVVQRRSASEILVFVTSLTHPRIIQPDLL
jgi:hypothetical protein